jgi:propanol-preferring alcohol dehydrogenase
MENYCENAGGLTSGGGLGHNGGMAPYMVVPATRYLVPLGTLDPREVAPLTDSALTTYHAIKRSLHRLGAGSTAVVIGVGGLGQMAIQILKALASATTVIAVNNTAPKLQIARDMGADEALISGKEAVKCVKDLTRGQGANLVLDIVGTDATLLMAAQMVRSMGDLTILGLGGGALSVSFFTLPHECCVTSPYWGSITELIEVISLAQAGKLKMLVEHFPLERASEAYRRLQDGKVRGRAVITPNG